MSIVGAAVVGIGLGRAATQFVFSYSKQEYEERVSKLQVEISKLESHEARLEELRNQIPGFWEDEQATKAYKLISEELSEVRRYTEWAKDTLQIMQETVQELDGKQNRLGNLLEELISMTGQLKV